MTREEELKQAALDAISEINKNTVGSWHGTSGRILRDAIQANLSSGSSPLDALATAAQYAFRTSGDYFSQSGSVPLPVVPMVNSQVQDLIGFVEREYGSSISQVEVRPAIHVSRGVAGILAVSQSYDHERGVPPSSQTLTYVYPSRRDRVHALTLEETLQRTFQRGTVARMVGVTTYVPVKELEDKAALTIVVPWQTGDYFSQARRRKR